MAITKLSLLAIFLCAQTAWANNPIPDHYLTDGNGFQAAYAAAPMWYMSSGSCLPSAAEDGRGAQTNGVDPDYCNVSKLNSGCPPEPAWQGAQTYYGNIPGEPFKAVPTYYNVVHCNGDSSGGDESWRILYYLYFKKDTGHKSDWEGVVQRFIRGDGGWIRESAIMEQDGRHPHVAWNDINDTFDEADWGTFGGKGRDHAKFYFSKFHHSVHDSWQNQFFKDTCNPTVPTSDSAYRNDDFQFWSGDHLRHVSVLNPGWQWGQADPPNTMDVCGY